VFAIAGVLAAAAFSLMTADRYVSSAVIKTDGSRQTLVSAVQRVESRMFLSQLINEEDLYKGERTRLPLEDVIEQMKQKDIRIAVMVPRNTTGTDGSAISISFMDPNAEHAQRTTQRLAVAFVDAAGGSILDQASLPGHPQNPRRSRIMLMGLIAGVLTGALFALFNGLKVWRLATALGIAGAVLFGAASYMMPENFTSTAVLVSPPRDEPKTKQLIDTVMSAASLHAIVLRFGLYANDHAADRKLSEHLHIESIQNARAISIQFVYPDQFTAQKVTANVASLLIGQDGQLEILDPPSLPQNPVSPNRETMAALGLLLGLTAAVVFRLTRRSPTLLAAR
jgi:uncharacterized protein involved in exopolysaccharide biosynthesis